MHNKLIHHNGWYSNLNVRINNFKIVILLFYYRLTMFELIGIGDALQ